MPPSPILGFYSGEAADHRGRSLATLQSQTHDSLEYTHDYIQWLFPLPEPSSANPNAPLLSAADIRAFQESEALRSKLVKSLVVMLHFYGLELSAVSGRLVVRRGPNFEARRHEWLMLFNHNFPRITRILRCLSLLGCAEHATAFFECLAGLYQEYPKVISQDTFEYWQSAVRSTR